MYWKNNTYVYTVYTFCKPLATGNTPMTRPKNQKKKQKYTSAYFLTPAISLKIQLYDVCKRLPKYHKSATKSDRNTQSHQITSTNFILLMAQKSG